MLTFLVGLVCAVVAQDAEPVQDAKPAQDHAALYQELIEAKSYSFEITIENKGGGFGGGRRGGRGGTQEPAVTVGKFQKEKAYHVKSGTVEAYRLEDMMVYREAEGEWKFYDPEELMNSFRNSRGRERGEGRERTGGGRPSEQDMIERFDTDGDGVLSDEERAAAREVLEKERTERAGERPERPEGAEGDAAQRDRSRSRFGNMRSIMELSRSTLPHETVKKIIGQLTDVAQTEAEGQILYKGKLTAEGAKAIAGGGMTFGRRGGFGGGGGEEPAFEYSGDVEVVLAKEAKTLEKIVITTTTAGDFMGREFESTRTTTITVKDLGKVEYEVPEEAMSLFVI